MAATLTLGWDAVSGTNISYRVYQSTGIGPFSLITSVTGTQAAVSYDGTQTNRWYVTSYSASYAPPESVPSNTVEVRPPTPPLTGLSFEAEAGSISAPFYVLNGLVQQDVTSDLPLNGGRAAYAFTITNAGTYTVSALVNAPNTGADSFFIAVDVEPVDANTWHIPNTVGFEWRFVRYPGETNDHAFALSAAAHVLIIRGREPGCQLDRLVIAPLSVTPPPIPGPPPPPGNLRANAITASRIDVAWAETTNLVSVERSMTATNFAQIGLVMPGNSFYIDTGLRRWTRYYYRVRAQNGGGAGPYSPIVSERTLKR